jgi:hypothetical protein
MYHPKYIKMLIKKIFIWFFYKDLTIMIMGRDVPWFDIYLKAENQAKSVM